VHVSVSGGDTGMNDASTCAKQTRCGNCIAAGCYWCTQQVYIVTTLAKMKKLEMRGKA